MAICESEQILFCTIYKAFALRIIALKKRKTPHFYDITFFLLDMWARRIGGIRRQHKIQLKAGVDDTVWHAFVQNYPSYILLMKRKKRKILDNNSLVECAYFFFFFGRQRQWMPCSDKKKYLCE